MTEKRFHKEYVLGDTGLIDEQKGEWFIENINNVNDLQKNWDKVIDKLNEVAEENKELQEFKDKVFNLIDKTIEDETQIAENIESTIEGDYVKAVNRLIIIAFENLKKELKEWAL